MVEAQAETVDAASIADCLLRRFRVDEYHRMLEVGGLAEGEKIELIDGLILSKPRRGPADPYAIHELTYLLARQIPDEYRLRQTLESASVPGVTVEVAALFES